MGMRVNNNNVLLRKLQRFNLSKLVVCFSSNFDFDFFFHFGRHLVMLSFERNICILF